MLRPLLALAAALAASVAVADTPVLPFAERPFAYPAPTSDLSPDGATAVTAFNHYEDREHRGIVRVWDVATGAVRADHPVGPTERVMGVTFAPDGRSVAAVVAPHYQARKVVFLDPATGRTLHTLDGFGGDVQVLGFSADGKQVRVTTQDVPPDNVKKQRPGPKRVETWDIAAAKRVGEEPWEGIEHPSPQARTPDGKLTVGYHPDGKVKWGYDPKTGLFALRPGAEPTVIPGSQGRAYTRLALSAGGKTLLGGKDGWADVVDVASGKLLRTLRDDTSVVASVAYADGGRLLFAAGGDGANRGKPPGEPQRGTVAVWDLKAGALRRVIGGFADAVTSIHPTPDGARAVAVVGGAWQWKEFVLLDVAAGTRIRTVANADHKLGHLAVAPGGRWLAAAEKGRVTVWDGRTGDALRTFDTTPDPTLGFTPDGKQLVVSTATETTWWDAAGGAKVKAWPAGEKGEFGPLSRPSPALSLHPSGKAAFGSTASAKRRQSHYLWRLTDTRREYLGEFWDYLSDPVVSPDGKWLAVFGSESPARDAFLTPLDADGRPEFDGRKVAWRTWRVGAGSVRALAFAPDGRTLATGGSDHVVRVWDVATQKLKATLYVAPPPLAGETPADWLAFTPDGFFTGMPAGRAYLRFRDPPGGAADRADRLLRPDAVRAALGVP